MEPTKTFSSIQEKMIADYLGWSVVSGSGAAACHPGDVISTEWLGECKTHVERDKKIFFSHSVWKKICDEAMTRRRYPVLFTDDGSQKSQRTWCLFSYKQVDESSASGYLATKCIKSTNISFSHDEMIEIYNSFNEDAGDRVALLKLNWNGQEVAVATLEMFRELFGGE